MVCTLEIKEVLGGNASYTLMEKPYHAYSSHYTLYCELKMYGYYCVEVVWSHQKWIIFNSNIMNVLLFLFYNMQGKKSLELGVLHLKM